MNPETKTRRYWLLRFWRPRDNSVRYAKDSSGGRQYSRDWYPTDERKHAYEFQSRSDAKRTARSKKFQDLVEGKRYQHGMRAGKRDASMAYFWEVVLVEETITTTFNEEIEVSNAPGMVQIARAAS